jgi:hypothetical protein
VTRDLVGFRKADVLVVDASEHAIACGDTDAKLLRRLQRKKGVLLYPYPMVFDYRFQLGKDTETGDEVWALRLWDNLIWLVGFPAPTSE